MSDDGKLRQRIREAIDAGRLPGGSPASMWGGPGCDAPCAICGVRIGSDEVGLELEFSAGDEFGRLKIARNGLNGHAGGNGVHSNGHVNGNGHGPPANGNGTASDNLHMHLRCHTAWDLARQENDQIQESGTCLPARDDHGTMSGCDRESRYERGSE